MLKRAAERHHEKTYFRECKIVVRFVPETENWAQGFIGGESNGANDKTFFTIREVSERKADRGSILLELYCQSSSVAAPTGILDVFEVGHNVLQVLIDFSVSRR